MVPHDRDLMSLAWILLGGQLMCLIALVGVLTTVLSAQRLPPLLACTWIVAGFSLFLVPEQLLSWHHCHRFPHGQGQPVAPS